MECSSRRARVLSLLALAAGWSACSVPGSRTQQPLDLAEPAQQVLLRFHVEKKGDGRSGSLRVVLRRQASGFELRASDPLGRGLWTLRVVSTGALWLDLRSRHACALPIERGARALGWPDLPWDVLPAIFLGEPPVAEGGRDSGGRRWTLERDAAGRVLSWSVREGESDSPLAFYRREGDVHFLSSDSLGVTVRWTEVAREQVPQAPPLLARPPAGYQPGGCDALELP